jgi:hypothetical protein
VGEQPGRLDGDGGIGEQFLHELLAPDGHTELGAFACVAHRGLQCGPGDSDGAGGDGDAALGQCAECDRQTLADLAQPGRVRHSDVLQGQGSGGLTLQTELAVHGLRGESLGVSGYQERAHAFREDRGRAVVEATLTRPAEVRQRLATLAELGCDELVLYPCSSDLAQLGLVADAVG